MHPEENTLNSINEIVYKPVKIDLKEEFIMTNNRKILTKRKNKSFCYSLGKCLCSCMRKVNTVENRYVYLNETDCNETNFKNMIRNQKYNILTFLPLVLLTQFSFFGNQFYLVMSASQFIDALKVGFLFAYIAPLAFVLIVTLIKEGYDDICRYKQDMQTNSQKYKKITNDGETVEIKSADIQVGDLIEINQNERIPADLIVLKAFNESEDHKNNNLFIRTDQLDGETDWKLRKAPQFTQKLSVKELIEMKGFIHYDPPSRMIYDFKGVLNIFDENNNSHKESLALENTLWSSTILASKKVLGIVIYTGKETRAQMNSSTAKMKVGMLDLEINTLNKILFVIMLILAFLITAIRGFNRNVLEWFIFYFRFIVLFCAIIPISLRVNLDISKSVYTWFISKDKNIPDTIARNSTIPEELGRVSYVFTDKTGTLTKNEMIFKRLALEMDQFSEESFQDLTMILQDECSHNNAPMLDILSTLQNNHSNSSSSKSGMEGNTEEKIANKRIRRNRNKIIRDAITAMAVCNNVTPIVDDNDPNQINYQASSPDEVALVKFAEKMNMTLTYRSDKEMKIRNASGFTEEYQILANFPFSSETKRMGILLKNITHGHIIFYLKGAENVIENFSKEDYKGHIRENAENLACIGLRTLVLTQKVISNEFYDKWIEDYHNAMNSMENRKENVTRVISKLETNMDFLCVTGVEDLLQDEVQATIENLRNAGMKIWMLTGDKVETATCISVSAGIKGKTQKFFYIRSDNSITNERITPEEIKQKLERLDYTQDGSYVLIIDGECLEICLNNYEKDFFDTAMKAPSVVCCRCSPTQKSKIVRTIKKYTDKRTCAVGDGGNDVAMIQEADVGIGIVGKEGLQASLAADFSIVKFMNLNLLLLWWGRLTYKNTATMAKFVIHRGLIISLIQFIFSIIFYCSAIPLYNGALVLGYSTVYTVLPVFSLLLDRDIDMKNVVKFPALYKKLLQGRELSIKAFLWWTWKSLFQASVIMVGAILLFGDNIFLKIVTITFTALIFAELLNVYSEIKTFHRLMTISLVGSLITYLLSLLFLKSILDLYWIFEPITFLKILALAVISWFPFFISYKCRSWCYPEAHEKLSH